MSRFQMKYLDGDDWKEVPEIDVLEKLLDEFGRVAPSVTQMIQGREINTAECIFRMKHFGNEGKIYFTEFNNYK